MLPMGNKIKKCLSVQITAAFQMKNSINADDKSLVEKDVTFFKAMTTDLVFPLNKF